MDASHALDAYPDADLAPEWRVEALWRAIAVMGGDVVEYLASGELRRHTQRMGREYKRRRALVLDALGGLDQVRVKVMDGGLHAVVESSRAEPELLARISGRGVKVAGLADYWSRPH